MDINLNPDQMAGLSNNDETIYLVDPQGTTVGIVSRVPALTEDEIQKALLAKRTPGRRYTTQEVLEYLNSLEVQNK